MQDYPFQSMQSLLKCCALCADMDGFKLLEHIGLELDLPVISESLPVLRFACMHVRCKMLHTQAISQIRKLGSGIWRCTCLQVDPSTPCAAKTRAGTTF